METISKYLTQQLIRNEVIQASDKEIYQYGLGLIISSGLICSCIMLVGLLTQKIALSVTFIIGVSQLRAYSGGYHASTYKRCFLLSNSAFLVALGITYLQSAYHLKYSLIIGSILAMIYLVQVGSVNSEKNPKTDEEMQQRKLRVRMMSLIYTLIGCFILIRGKKYMDMATIIICTQIITAFLLWYLKIQRRHVV